MSEDFQELPGNQWRLQEWLGIDHAAKPRVYQLVFDSAKINSLIYWLEILLSAGIAAFGLVESSPAVIIGAMLISPLMGPIMATGMALTVGDLYLGMKAVLNLLISVTVSIAFSGFLVWLLPFHSVTSEIAARTNPNLLDLGIALFSGLAGSIVICRGGNDGVTALPGVAIAVALMPPLCTMGFGLGSGPDLEIMGGAGLLFLTNLVAIVASAFLVFLLVGMNTSEVRQALFAARKREPLARLLSHSPIARMLETGSNLRWRILMILILLGAIAVPLGRALLQVANETLTRGAVQSALKRLAPPDALVSQQVSISGDEIVIRLISTRSIPEATLHEVQQDLMRQTRRNVQMSVEAVVSKGELADLRERLARPAPAPVAVKPPSFEEIQKDLLGRVQPALAGIWPSVDAPMQNFDVSVGTEGTAIHVRYDAPKELGPVPINMVLQSLRTQLALPDLTLTAERVRPARAPAPVKRKQK